MPPFRTRPIRANPYKQGDLRIYVNDGERMTSIRWESRPDLEAFGLAEDGALIGLPGRGLGRCWWTPSQMHFSLAHESNIDIIQLKNNRFKVGNKIYTVPKGISLTNIQDSPEALAFEMERSIRATLSDYVEVGDVSSEVVPGMLLVTMRDKHRSGILWILLEPGTSLIRGAGRVYWEVLDKECFVTSASLEESIQGKGHYRNILRYLRNMTGAPIYSDNSLSLKAIIAWKKMGKTTTAKSWPMTRFKLNNPPNRVDILYRMILRDTIVTAAST